MRLLAISLLILLILLISAHLASAWDRYYHYRPHSHFSFRVIVPPPVLLPPPPPIVFRGYYYYEEPRYYGDGCEYREWVPGHWEERWTPYGWERVWVPGHWRYRCR
jgi:hypothetical protein